MFYLNFEKKIVPRSMVEKKAHPIPNPSQP
jgi:hypothetical protein